MFQLESKEIPIALKSQIATLNESGNKRGLHIKKMPFAFTEQGIYMLATVLRGDLAKQQSIFIMRTFRKMRHYFIQNQQLVTRSEMELVTAKVVELDNDNKTIHKDIEMLGKNFVNKDELVNIVIYDNKKFEADVAYCNIYRKAKKSIYVIDDYVSIDTLQLLTHKKRNIEVILFTDNKSGKNNNCLVSKEVIDFNNEYPLLRIKPNKGKCHDRYIIIDYKTKNEKIYHCGASSKDAGNKLCTISRINDNKLMHPAIESLLRNEDDNNLY